MKDHTPQATRTVPDAPESGAETPPEPHGIWGMTNGHATVSVGPGGVHVTVHCGEDGVTAAVSADLAEAEQMLKALDYPVIRLVGREERMLTFQAHPLV